MLVSFSSSEQFFLTRSCQADSQANVWLMSGWFLVVNNFFLSGSCKVNYRYLLFPALCQVLVRLFTAVSGLAVLLLH